MQSTAISPSEYIENLPEDRKTAMQQLRETILDHIPNGFEETMTYGMISYVVPHSIYPAGYHCDPKLPLGMMSIVSQKNFISLHHIGLYGDAALLKWFTDAYGKHSKAKLDMGKGCVRFKKTDQIPFKLIGELAAQLTPKQWIDKYESTFKR